MNTRQYWVDTLLKIATPVFAALSQDNLRNTMSLCVNSGHDNRDEFAHLEALGRSLAGIGPWLNQSAESAKEESQRSPLADQVRHSLKVAVDPNARDFLNFTQGSQPLVDAAFLAQGLMRSFEQIWQPLDSETQGRIVRSLAATRQITPPPCNWLLFSAIIEAFLCKAGHPWNRDPIEHAITQHQQWYVGDGAYGDGPHFHWDYYNSFVIQPMLYDVINACHEITTQYQHFTEPVTRRIQRYAAVQERLIAPDGTYPPIGRSIVYRFGAFHALALVAYENILPTDISPPGVRCALTRVIQKTLAPNTFDDHGWLQIGLSGHQPALSESYISTGSLYLCLTGLLPLGLPESHRFWSDPDCDWTSMRIWNGENLPADHAIDD